MAIAVERFYLAEGGSGSLQQRIRAMLPEVDKVFTDYAARRHTPGLVWAILLDGQVVHTGARGWGTLHASSGSSTMSRWSASPSISRTLQEPQVPLSHELGTTTCADRNASRMLWPTPTTCQKLRG